MITRYCGALVVFLSVFAALNTAVAGTVTVTPSNMNGWATAMFTRGTAKCGFYPAPAGAPGGSGTSAFYASTGEFSIGSDAGEVPAQVWIGTNAFVGVQLKDITKLTYSTYTFFRGIDNSHWASQPIQLQLVVQKSPTDTNKRLLMYRPWGLYSPEEIVCSTPNPWGKWETHEAYRTLSNIAHIDSSQGNAITRWGRWFVANGDQLPHTWDEIANPTSGILRNAVICAPDPGFGWDGGTNPVGSPVVSGTGCGLNFTVGGRKNVTNIFTTTGYQWSREGWNFSGYVDSFTIGISGVETTYNFEDNARSHNYAITIKQAVSQAVTLAKDKYKFVVFGKVKTLYKTPAANKIVDPENFELSDGSGRTIRVRTTSFDPNVVKNDSFVRVEGVIDPLANPVTINTQESGIRGV